MREMKKNLADTIQKINSMTEYFYQQRYAEGEKCFSELVNQLLAVTQNLSACLNQEGKVFIDSVVFNAKLAEALTALQKKDFVLLADIFEFEIKVQLESIVDIVG